MLKRMQNVRYLVPSALYFGLVLVSADGLAVAADPLKPPAIQTEGVPQVPSELIERLSRYQNTRSASFRGWAPDGKGILIQTRFGNTSQLHRVYEPSGRRQQVTFFDEPARGRFLPADEFGSILLTMSSGGNEKYQVFFYDGEMREARRITDGKSRNLLGPVRDDGLFMIISNNSRNGRDTDLYIASPHQTGELSPLMQTTGEYWIPMDWSRDGSTILINRYVSRNESYPALLSVATGKKRKIPVPGGRKGKVSFGDMKFSPDGKSAYMVCDADGEFRRLARVDLTSFEFKWLSADIPWDVEQIAINPASGIGSIVPAAFTINQGGSSELFLLLGDKHDRVDLPIGIIGSLEFAIEGTRLAFTHSRPNGPSDVWSLGLLEPGLIRWTYSEIGGLDEGQFISPKMIKFKTFDERMIPAFYFKPRSATQEKPAAVIVNIHGGPESQYRPYFSSSDQFYLNELGIAVIRPNVRGSAGYGKSYLLMDNGDKREDSVRDIGALLEWIAAQPELDASRVAVMGGSYGGYMVLGSLTHFSDRLKAGVDIVGIASFATFLKNTSEYRRDLRRAEYGDERDPKMKAFFNRIDPVKNAAKIKTSLLVAHGVNDPRVPYSEAEQIAPKVRANGQTVWTVYADNEGHGFRKKANRDYLYAVIALFLRDRLK